MDNETDKAKCECIQMSEVLEAVFSEENMPDMTQDVRARLRAVVAQIEGSDGNKMTCITKEDYPRADHIIKRAIITDNLSASPAYYNVYNRAVNKWLQGSLRSMNKHCDECLKDECERRSVLTREQIKATSKLGVPISSRGSKIMPITQEEDMLAYEG